MYRQYNKCHLSDVWRMYIPNAVWLLHAVQSDLLLCIEITYELGEHSLPNVAPGVFHADEHAVEAVTTQR